MDGIPLSVRLGNHRAEGFEVVNIDPDHDRCVTIEFKGGPVP